MPETRVLLFKDDDGTVPILEWFHRIPKKAVDKCLVKIEILQNHGYELRRPLADYLRDGIYELRASLQGTHYRILYFFHENTAIIISHGLIKEQRVPPKEIEYAIKRKELYLLNPEKHTYEGERT